MPVVLPLVSASDLARRPPPAREWLVEGLLPAGTITLLAGDGGSGKTQIALQVAAAVAAGTPALGRHVTPGKAVILSCEDDAAELHRRVVEVAHCADLRPEQLAGLTLIVGADLPDGALAREAGRGELEWTDLYRALREMIEAERPALLVLDPVSECFQGDEVNRKQVAGFVGGLRRLAQRTGTAILLVTHPSVSGMADRSGRSGSTAWANAARARLFLERVDGDPDARKMSVTKSNIGRLGDTIALRWNSGVFEFVAEPTAAERADERDRAKAALLAVMTRVIGQGRTLSPKPGKNSAVAIADGEPETKGITKAELEAALRDLLAAGAVRAVETGPASRRRTELTVAEGGDRRPTAIPSPLRTPLRSPTIPYDPSLPSIPPYPPRTERRPYGFEPVQPVPLEDAEPAQPGIEGEDAAFASFHC